MIGSFADEETRKIHGGVPSKRFPRDIQRVARRKLIYLDDAGNLRDLFSPPGNQLEKLKGDRQGQYSIRINNQWRICFDWKNKQAENVEIADYHS